MSKRNRRKFRRAKRGLRVAGLLAEMAVGFLPIGSTARGVAVGVIRARKVMKSRRKGESWEIRPV